MLQSFSEQGYLVLNCITDELLKSCRSAVINTIAHHSGHNFDSWDHLLNSYCAHACLHQSLTAKNNRTFTVDTVDKILSSGLHDIFQSYFPRYIISDEESLGYPNIYFRVVRPSQPADVGPLHADRWFWDLNSWSIPSGYIRTKFWFPLSIEAGLSGLRMASHSHKQIVSYSVRTDSNGKSRPSEVIFDNSKAVLLETNIGDGVFFDDNIIHGGAVNLGSYPRVSVEMTLLSKTRSFL